METSFLKKYSYYITFILFISFAPYFVFYNHNFEQITFNKTMQPLMLLSILVFFLFVVLYFLINIFPKYYKLIFASTIIFLIFIINFDYIFIDLIKKELSIKNSYLSVLMFLFIYLLSVFIFLRLLKIKFLKNFLLFYSIFTLVMPALELSLKSINNDENNIQKKPKTEDFLLERTGTINNKSTLKENVYFILLDGYASKKTFSRMSFNNDNFYRYLEKSNFTNLGDKASYNMTYLAMSSIFNLSYPVVEGDIYNDRLDFFPFLLNNNKKPSLIEELDNLQYEFIFYGNYWSGCIFIHAKCGNPSKSILTYESTIFFSKTALKFFYIGNNDLQYDAISSFLKKDKEIKIQDSKFHFFHHLSPHPPYLENDCKTVQSISLTGWEPLEDYLLTVNCVNTLLMELISYLDKNDPSAIIIFQSDHGPETSSFTLLQATDFDGDIHIDNRISILNTIRSPKKCDKWLKNNLGPINATKFILGCIKQEEPIYLEEKTFIGHYENHKDFGTVKEFN